MTRPVLFDATHLIARQEVAAPTGIDRVDLAYATAFGAADHGVTGVTCGLGKPRLIGAARLRDHARALQVRWARDGAADEDPAFQLLRGFVTASRPPTQTLRDTRETLPLYVKAARYTRTLARLLEHDAQLRIPEGAILLNVTQNPVLVPRLEPLLRARPDLKPVFFLHDMIPVDYPEYFAADRQKDFQRVLAVMFKYAAGFIVTTDFVRARLQEEIRRRALASIPIHVAHLPTPPSLLEPPSLNQKLADARYVVIVGTVEPRKNHWLLLHLWRQMIAAGDQPPRLVAIGTMGWLTDALADLFTRTPELQPYVLQVSGMSDNGLKMALAHARALLFPSFVEGFGIPLVEAACLGTPIIAGSHPVLGEVSQGRAITVDPLDGPGWRDSILALAGPDSHPRTSTAPLPGFRPQTTQAYFHGVREFLAGL